MIKNPKPQKPKKAKDKKKRLEAKGIKLWFEFCYKPCCELCGEPTKDVHHFFLKSDAGWLKYDPDNAVSLCASCHTRKHWKNDPRIDIEIRQVKGEKWYQNIVAKRNNVPKGSYKTLGWLKEQIQKLTSTNDTGIPKFYDNT